MVNLQDLRSTYENLSNEDLQAIVLAYTDNMIELPPAHIEPSKQERIETAEDILRNRGLPPEEYKG